MILFASSFDVFQFLGRKADQKEKIIVTKMTMDSLLLVLKNGVSLCDLILTRSENMYC